MSTLRRTLILSTSLIALPLASCSTFQKNGPVATPSAPSVQWYQVKQSPPSYFPKGLSKHSPTTAYHGFWVSPGNGTQWFVPSNGIKGASAQQLRADVLRKNPALAKTKKTAVSQKLKSAGSTVNKSVSNAYTSSKAWTQNSASKAYKGSTEWSINAASTTYNGTKRLAKKVIFWH